MTFIRHRWPSTVEEHLTTESSDGERFAGVDTIVPLAQYANRKIFPAVSNGVRGTESAVSRRPEPVGIQLNRVLS